MSPFPRHCAAASCSGGIYRQWSRGPVSVTHRGPRVIIYVTVNCLRVICDLLGHSRDPERGGGWRASGRRVVDEINAKLQTQKLRRARVILGSCAFHDN